MPLLTAFMTRADHSNGTTVYNGTETGDVGTNYVASAYNAGAQAQLGGVNYVRDYTKVTPKALTISGVDKIYNGTTDATLTADNLSGVVEGDTLTVSTTSATYADKNVGTGKTVTYAGLTLGGTKAKNYTIDASGTGTGDITAKALTVTFADISKTYDGTKKATAGAGTLTGVIDDDKEKVSVAADAEYADKNAGTGKTVNYTGVALSGDEKDNYTIAATATGKGTINKANITISVEDMTKTYDGGTGTADAAGGNLKVTSGTLFAGDEMSDGTKTFTDKNAGTGKTVTVSGVTITDGNNGGNYNVTYADNTTSTIYKKDIIVSFDTTTKTYDGTTDAPLGEATFVGILPADKGKLVVTADAAFMNKNYTGTHTGVEYTNIKLTGAEAGNYHLTSSTANGEGTITRKALSLVATPVTITEGEATPTTFTGTIAGFVAGEGLAAGDALSFALENPAAAAVGSYKVAGTLNGKESGNYSVDGQNYNYTFANAASNATAFTIKMKAVTPEELVANATENQGAAVEYTNVVGSIESGANVTLPTTGGGNPLATPTVTPTTPSTPASGTPTSGTPASGTPEQNATEQQGAPTTQPATEQQQQGAVQPAVEQNGTEQKDEKDEKAQKQPEEKAAATLSYTADGHITIVNEGINAPASMDAGSLAASLSGTTPTTPTPTEQAATGAQGVQGVEGAQGVEATPAAASAPEAEPTSAQGAAQDDEEE